MPRIVMKSPGTNLAAGVASGDVVKVRPGVYPPFSTPSNLSSVRWEWAEAGQHWTVDGRGKAEFNVRINDGATALAFVGMRSINGGHGVRATVSRALRFSHYIAEDCGAEGLQTGYCDGELIIEDFKITGTGKGWTGSDGFHYDPHKGHGIYCSKKMRGSREHPSAIIRRGRIGNCGGCAIQLNANDGDFIEWVTIEDVVTYGCGSEGTPGFNWMGVRNSTMRRVLAAHNNAGLALFSDGGSEACFDNTFERVTWYQPKGKYGLQSLAGSLRNKLDRCIVITGGKLFEGNGLGGEVLNKPDALVDPANGDYRSDDPNWGWAPASAPDPPPPPPPPPPPAGKTRTEQIEEKFLADGKLVRPDLLYLFGMAKKGETVP